MREDRGKTMARIAIVGVGAIGGGLAALLDVQARMRSLCARGVRSQRSWSTLRQGMSACERGTSATPHLRRQLTGCWWPQRAYDAEGTAKWFPALCAKRSACGHHPEWRGASRAISEYLSADKLLPVVIDLPTERKAEDRVHIRGSALIKIEDTKLGQSFAALFGDYRPAGRICASS